MQRRGQRKEEPLDDILVTEGPALLKSAVQILLQQDVFTPKSFMKELSLYGLSIYPSEVEMLLNLPEETLTSSKIIYLPNLQLKDK